MSATLYARCQHSSDWHRLDDSTNVSPVDPAAEFRCYGYDVEAPGPYHAPGELCSCPDFVTEGWPRFRDIADRLESLARQVDEINQALDQYDNCGDHQAADPHVLFACIAAIAKVLNR